MGIKTPNSFESGSEKSGDKDYLPHVQRENKIIVQAKEFIDNFFVSARYEEIKAQWCPEGSDSIENLPKTQRFVDRASQGIVNSLGGSIHGIGTERMANHNKKSYENFENKLLKELVVQCLGSDPDNDAAFYFEKVIVQYMKRQNTSRLLSDYEEVFKNDKRLSIIVRAIRNAQMSIKELKAG